MFPFLARIVLLEIIYLDLCSNTAEVLFALLSFPKAKMEILKLGFHGDLESLEHPLPWI